MNIAMAAGKAMPLVGKSILYLKKFSPEILMGAGVIGFVATNVLSSKASLKLEDKLIDMREDIKSMKQAGEVLIDETEDTPVYGKKDYRLDLTRLYLNHSFELVKLYAPSFVVGTLSITALLGSHQIMRNRNVALMAAYQTVSGAYNSYRELVKGKIGEEEERNLRFGIKEVETKDVETDKEGKEVVKVKKAITVGKDPNEYSPYARIFDESSLQWEKDPTYNLHYLRAQQSYFNDMLRSRGHVFLNEVYDALGVPRTKAGQVVGWIISKDGDNFVDFGIYDLNNPSGRAFVNGLERSILLDFNVDGIIYDKI